MVYQNLDRTYDSAMLLHDKATAVTADALCTVGGSASAGIIDVGDTDVCLDIVVDVSAIDVTSSDEVYYLQVTGSDSSSHASGVVLLGTLVLGDHVGLLAGGTGLIDTDRGTGRHILTVRNRIGSATYRYIRMNVEVGASTTPSITFTAFAAPAVAK